MPVALAQEGAGSQLWAKALAASRRSQLQTQMVSSSQCQHRRLTGGDNEHGLGRPSTLVPVPAHTPSPYMTSLQVLSSSKWVMIIGPRRWLWDELR